MAAQITPRPVCPRQRGAVLDICESECLLSQSCESHAAFLLSVLRWHKLEVSRHSALPTIGRRRVKLIVRKRKIFAPPASACLPELSTGTLLSYSVAGVCLDAPSFVITQGLACTTWRAMTVNEDRLLLVRRCMQVQDRTESPPIDTFCSVREDSGVAFQRVGLAEI